VKSVCMGLDETGLCFFVVCWFADSMGSNAKLSQLIQIEATHYSVDPS